MRSLASTFGIDGGRRYPDYRYPNSGFIMNRPPEIIIGGGLRKPVSGGNGVSIGM